MRVATAAFLAVTSALAAACCSASTGGKGRTATDDVKVTLFFTTELRGNIEPCGCTSNPMGDLARVAEVVAGARRAKGAVLYVDGGSMLYQGHPIPEHLAAQEALKADLLVEALTQHLGVAAIGLGPHDLAVGAGGVRPPRHAVNLPRESGVPIEEPKLVEVGGAKVGVFGVAAPSALASFGIEAADPMAAARTAAADLRERGARLVVGIAYMPRKQALALARAVDGIDFLLAGQNAPEPRDIRWAPNRAGDTWVVQPANRGQILTRVDVTLRGEGAIADAIGQARAAAETKVLDGRIDRLRGDLDKWAEDPNADPDFLATKKKELAGLEAERAELAESPLRVPEKGSWFAMSQIEIVRGLPCDANVQSAKLAYDKAVGEANVKASADRKPPPPAKGKPAYVGWEDCEECHESEAKHWKRTGHARAWATLEKVAKQFNYDCIGCHVTGWQQPGGSTLAFNEHLRNVQCETCHGPGSIHVDALGEEKPSAMLRKPPESLCTGCHNQDHSDTFEYEAYLRNTTGPGHGKEFRDQLGDGPTGRELRSAAEKRAGEAIGAGCSK